MRQHKILTRTLLTLSIINLALAAPVAVRERHEVRLGATVTRNVAAVSQKRWDPFVENVPGSDHAPPPSPDLADVLSQMKGQLAAQHRYINPRPSPDSLGSFTGSRLPMGSMPVVGPLFPPPEPASWSLNVLGSDYAPPRKPLYGLGSLSGSHLPVGSMSVANPLSPPPEPVSWSLNVLEPDHAPPRKPLDGKPLYGLGSLSGSHLPVGSMSVANPLSPPPEPVRWSLNVLGPDHAPPRKPGDGKPLYGLGSLSGSHLPVGSMSVANPLSPPPEPVRWSLNVLGPDHAPPRKPGDG